VVQIIVPYIHTHIYITKTTRGVRLQPPRNYIKIFSIVKFAEIKDEV